MLVTSVGMLVSASRISVCGWHYLRRMTLDAGSVVFLQVIATKL